MTKEEFLRQVNKGRYPKYTFSQIKDGIPDKDCNAIICTESDSILLAKYQNGVWQQACLESTEDVFKQEMYYANINEGIIYYIDGEAEDCSREQFS